MTPDPQRSWFVYFKDQEMGPFTEEELLGKVRVGEIDHSAYVFTEGMPDWASLPEVEVLNSTAESAPLEMNVESGGLVESMNVDSTPVSEPVIPDEEAEPLYVEPVGEHSHHGFEESSPLAQEASISQVRKIQNEKVSLEAAAAGAQTQLGQTPPSITENPRSKRWLIPAIIVGILVVGAWAVVELRLLPRALQSKVDSALILLGGEAPHESQKAAAHPAASSTTMAAPVKGQLEALWEELTTLRFSSDTQGPPFRIATVILGEQRPLILGALSSMIDTNKIVVMVFPDNEKNLMPKPRVWTLELPLLDGYFTIGPLTLDGKPIPEGTYKVMAQAKQKFLGTVSFDVGRWPTGPDLDVRMKALVNERLGYAAEERKALEERFRRLNLLFDNLQTSARVSVLQPKRKQWTSFAAGWKNDVVSFRQSMPSKASFVFYPAVQDRMTSLAAQLQRLAELLEIYSERGKPAFEKAARKRYPDLWTEVTRERDNLKGDIVSLEQQGLNTPVLDENILKARLLEIP